MGEPLKILLYLIINPDQAFPRHNTVDIRLGRLRLMLGHHVVIVLTVGWNKHALVRCLLGNTKVKSWISSTSQAASSGRR